MMNWIFVALTVAQVAQGLETELGGGVHSLDFTTLGTGPWVPSDDTWVWQDPSSELSNSQARKMLGRRELLSCAGSWAQCGGKKHTGPTCCTAGNTCVVGNEWYSQCIPGDKKPAPMVEESDPKPKSPEPKSPAPKSPAPKSPAPKSPPSQVSPALNSRTSGSGVGSGFTGDATYYSDETIGACTQKWKPSGFRTVAVNSKQWNGGNLCGTCVEGYYMENGNRNSFKAIIDNLCPECAYGDLDFRQPAGGPGDGRWNLEWKIIDCPSSRLTAAQEGSNRYYSKIKAEGGPAPVSTMKCGNISGKRTEDSFFEFNHGGGVFCAGVTCDVTFANGATDSLNINTSQLGAKC